MSRQSKNARLRAAAKVITSMHLRGEKGPKATTPQHGKDPAKRLYTASKRGQKDQRGGKPQQY